MVIKDKITDTIIEHSVGNTELIEQLMKITKNLNSRLSALEKAVEENEKAIDVQNKYIELLKQYSWVKSELEGLKGDEQ